MIDIQDLKPEAVLCLDISEYAAQIERLCEPFLLPAPKGIYIKNRLYPVLVEGRTYFTEKKVGSGVLFVPIEDINLVEGSVYSESRKLLIPQRMMSDKARWISDSPILPYRGTEIVKLYAKNQIDNFVSYRKYGSNYLSRVYAHMLPTRTQEEAEKLDDVLQQAEHTVYEHLRKKINEFIINHDWNIYFVCIKDRILTIERYCDWRIYDWTNRMESGEWK